MFTIRGYSMAEVAAALDGEGAGLAEITAAGVAKYDPGRKLGLQPGDVLVRHTRAREADVRARLAGAAAEMALKAEVDADIAADTERKRLTEARARAALAGRADMVAEIDRRLGLL